MAISGILPYNGDNLIGVLAQNTATAPNGLSAAIRKSLSAGSSMSAQDAAELMLSIPNPAFTVSLGSLSSAAGTPEAGDNSNILPNNPPVAQAVFNPASSPPLEAATISPALSNLEGVVSTGVLQANQALAQSLLGVTNPEPPLESLLPALSNLQAVQHANPTELNPSRAQYFFTEYFKTMNMSISPTTGSKVDTTA